MADTTPQTLPYTQAWTNTGLITANDNWSGVAGVTGYLGQDITLTTGADPQTLLTDSAVANDLDVIANQTSTAITTGGVAEFEITDPVVALQGSGTADAPHLLLTLDTTGASNVNVAYNLRDIDGTADNAVQPVALQYRVGSTGSWTNVPAGYVSDATTGPSIATLVTPVSVPLPAAAGNQPVVQVRVITSNAVGSDEWVGVDDISVTAPGVTSLSIDSVTMNEGNAGTTSFDFTVSLSAPAGAGGVTFDIATADNTATTADSDYATKSLTGQTISAGNSSYNFSVLVNGDTATESDETFFVNVTNVTGATVADGQGLGTITNDDAGACGDPSTAIHTIQGSGTSSPLAGQIHAIDGVVVGDFQGTGSFGGYYVQEADADADADPNTSEGIFVFSSTAVSLGDNVRVAGTVTEFASGTTTLTELTSVTSLLICSTSNALPTETTVTLPVSAVSDWERFEGMRISISQTLTVTETFTLARFGEVLLSEGGRLFSPTNVTTPGAAAIALQEANNKRKILLDDGNSQQNIDPTIHPVGGLSAANTLRSGYTVAGVAGILDQRFSLYRIQPTAAVNFIASNPRTAAPDAVGGTLKVASFNVLNYFNGDGAGGGFPTARGATTLEEFGRQRDKEIAALTTMNADIVGLMEMENDADPNSAVADLVSGLNDATAPGTYAYIDTGVIGTDAIRVALIYKPGSVTPVGAYEILDSSDDIRFIDTLNRPALAQTFSQNSTGERLTVVVNHLKSKNASVACDADNGDGQGNCNLVREAAAQALVDWLATDPTNSGDPDSLIIGDLNSYAMEDPITAIRAGADDTASTADDYTDLIASFLGAGAYSYVFDGQSGYLDHALSSSTLTGQVTGAAEWHINADEPIALDYNKEFKSANQVNTFYSPDAYRSSDHDPVIIGLELSSEAGVRKVSGKGEYAGGKFDLLAEFKNLSTLPTGKTKFTLNGGLQFNSTGYDWLIGSDNSATYQGSGKLNGVAGYKFRVEVVDGGKPGAGNDWIRIVIWQEGGSTVFDQSGYLTKGDLTVLE